MTLRSRRVAGVFALALAALVVLAWLGVTWQQAGIAWTRAGSDPLRAVFSALVVVLSALFSWSGFFLVALVAFLVGVGGRLLRAPDAVEASDAARGRADARAPTTPVDVPPDEAELAEGPVAACLRCGSTRMRILSFADGVFLGGGETLTWVCDRCHWRGMPLHFDDPTAYRQFVKGLHADRDASGPGEAASEKGTDAAPTEERGP